MALKWNWKKIGGFWVGIAAGSVVVWVLTNSGYVPCYCVQKTGGSGVEWKGNRCPPEVKAYLRRTYKDTCP